MQYVLECSWKGLGGLRKLLKNGQDIDNQPRLYQYRGKQDKKLPLGSEYGIAEMRI